MGRGTMTQTATVLVTRKKAIADPVETVDARLQAAYERKGHHYHESDCMVLGASGEELMIDRHTGIFLVAARERTANGAREQR